MASTHEWISGSKDVQMSATHQVTRSLGCCVALLNNWQASVWEDGDKSTDRRCFQHQTLSILQHYIVTATEVHKSITSMQKLPRLTTEKAFFPLPLLNCFFRCSVCRKWLGNIYPLVYISFPNNTLKAYKIIYFFCYLSPLSIQCNVKNITLELFWIIH